MNNYGSLVIDVGRVDRDENDGVYIGKDLFLKFFKGNGNRACVQIISKRENAIHKENSYLVKTADIDPDLLSKVDSL